MHPSRVDHSSQSAYTLVNVTFDEYRNIYTYDAITLWFAYGAAVLFTAVAVVVGLMALWLDGVSFDDSFSTILRTSRINTDTEGSGHGEHHEDHVADNGAQPLPHALANATVIINAAQCAGRCRKLPTRPTGTPGDLAGHANASDTVNLLPMERCSNTNVR